MAKIISIHSFRGGTGKSNITANIAALLAAEGRRVGVVDTDIQSPGIHVLFGMAGETITHSLNDFLWGKCDIQKTAHDVTPVLGADIPGQILLIPSSIKPGDITQVLREGYDAQLLTKGFRNLVKDLELDVLMIDTHPGLNEETLLSIAISHALAIIMRPDQQDYEGTGVTVQVARKLEVPRMLLIVNKVPAVFDAAEVKAKVAQTYNCEVGAVLPHSDEMMTLASTGIFVLRYPDHPVTAILKEVAAKLAV
ncbi:MAG: MinD/ParA family protein [bacterium]|nr:MinD/ParA family protein [bacterium]